MTTRAFDCAGCLGTDACWICLGTGKLERANGKYAACHGCAGTAICVVCQPLNVIALPAIAPQRAISGLFRRNRRTA
jgi:hypothetical protein